MYFYVFLEPKVFEEALADGEDAMQSVSGILECFRQNCFLAVFEDGRWDSNIKEVLKDWPATNLRMRITKMLVHLKKQNRFLHCLRPDYGGAKSDLDCVFDQAVAAPLDLLLVVAGDDKPPKPGGVEIGTRRTYYDLAFEETRSALAVYGKTCSPGDMKETEFLEFHFTKALMFAREIHICDRVCGKKNLSDNFRYTIKRFIVWLGATLAQPLTCKIVFHLGKPIGYGMDFVIEELRSIKNSCRALSGTAAEVHFYNEVSKELNLPHQRFILTDQIALNVDRGLDFLDKSTHCCRDTYVNYQNAEEARRLLDSCSSGYISSHMI